MMCELWTAWISTLPQRVTQNVPQKSLKLIHQNVFIYWTATQGAPNNENTIVVNNGVTKFADPPGGGLIENNYEGLDVKEQGPN